MSVVVRGLVCAALLARSRVAHAEATPKAGPAPAPSVTPAPSAAPVASVTAVPAVPAVPPANIKTVRVYMRAEPEPLSFSARAESSDGTPTWCVAPCDARLVPGNYELKLNGVFVDRSVPLRDSGTLRGELHSRAGARAGAWLGLNVGGILGGVFITVAALGGPSWAYIAGGGSLAAGGVIFVVAYRADRATVSFTPGEPNDVRGMPPTQGPSAGGQASSAAERGAPAAQARSLGFRLEF